MPASGIPGLSVFRARGNSMHPFFPDGTVLFFEARGTVRVGDVVLVENDGRLLAHRVTSLWPGVVETWGDWNREPDPVCPLEQVSGRCVLAVRKGSTLPLESPVFELFGRMLARSLPVVKALRHATGL